MADDYNENDNEYWDDMYYYENHDKDLDPNSWTGNSRHKKSLGFWIWLIVFIIACNISSSIGSIVLVIGIVGLIIGKLIK